MIRKRDKSFSETRIDDEFVVMILDTGEFLSLAGSAGAIWERIDGTRDRDAIVTELVTEYEAPRDEIARDVDAFLATLRNAGLIVES